MPKSQARLEQESIGLSEAPTAGCPQLNEVQLYDE
jgi:hypothetical protein